LSKLRLEENLRDSTRDFIEKVWPVIKDWCGGGELIPVEEVVASPFASKLDRYSGIDHWQIRSDLGQIRGIASRIQWGHDWRTFTIRYFIPGGWPTEFQKRMAALDHPHEGWLFPGLTCQAYLDQRGGSLLSVAVIPTHQLYAWIKKHSPGLRCKPSPTGERFLVVNWSDLVGETDIKIWTRDGCANDQLRLF